MKNLTKLFILITFSFLISACSHKIKQSVGLTNAGPNEYSVTKNKPLEVPPHFDLNEIEGRKVHSANSLEDGSLNSGEKALLEASQKK